MANLSFRNGELKPGPTTGFGGAYLIYMTDPERSPNVLETIAGLPRHCMVIFRHYEDPDRRQLARRVAALCRRRGLTLLVAADAGLAQQVGARGLHLPAHLCHRARALRRRPNWLLTAAAHSEAEIVRARRQDVDVILLSPVFRSGSHPQADLLGPCRFARLVRRAGLPVVALGGVNQRTMRRLRGSGHAGVAGISLFR